MKINSKITKITLQNDDSTLLYQVHETAHAAATIIQNSNTKQIYASFEKAIPLDEEEPKKHVDQLILNYHKLKLLE